MNKIDIRNLSFEELSEQMKVAGEKSFRTTQIFAWIYQKDASSFDGMGNLSKNLREELSENFSLEPLKISDKKISDDKTTKFLFELDDNEEIETVLIPTKTRTTVCLSTQVGCKFGCKFCASGLGGWKRNLTVSEILVQVLHVKEEAAKRHRPLSHVVFMGVGEPFDNFENVIKACRIINDKKAINIGARRITISTCGVIPRIQELAEQRFQIELAISLHGYDNNSRDILMPVNKKYPFDDLMAACRNYIQKTKRQITFEYILIQDITCSESAIKALKKAFRGIICKMNLIPYNPVSEFDHRTPSKKEIVAFKNRLGEFGIHATVRQPRGQDVAAACGQLRRQMIQSKK